MSLAGALSGALMLLVEPAAAAPPAHPASLTESRFAPPTGQPMTYRVTTRRIGRSGTLISFSLVYALQWHRAGRGYRLDATLRRIESDARPELVAGLTGLLQPLVGEPVAYLVEGEGRSIALADAGQLWARVAERTGTLAAAAAAPEARQMAALIAALPEAERDKLASADIRALIGPANDAIPMTASGDATVSIREEGGRRTIARIEQAALGAAAPLQVDILWTLDTATGLVLREQRQSWIVESGSGAKTLVEERIRALTPGDPG